MLSLLFRHRWITVTLLALAGTAAFFYHTHPTRRLHRTWQRLLDTVEARQVISLRALISPAYSDRWGHDRDLLLLEAREAFRRLESIRLEPEQVVVSRRGDEAVITAVIRLKAAGPPPAEEARAAVNGLFSPFDFSWRKEPGYLGAWQLVRCNHPEFPLERFRRRAGFE